VQRRYSVVQDRSGNAISGASITVTASDGGLATLYSDNGVTPTSNPVTTNTNGEYAYYAANGIYSESIAASGFVGETIPGVTLFDALDPSKSLPLLTNIIGVDPTGVGDSTAAIQSALSKGVIYFVPPGRYRITSPLTAVDGAGLVAEPTMWFWQYIGNAPSVGKVAEIYYDGPAAANSAVFQWSKVPVGTLPTSQLDESQTVHGTALVGLVINGNGKADFGVYAARAGLGNNYSHLIVTGTNKRGFFFGEFWLTRVGPLFAIHNNGTGGCIGEDLFSWSTQNVVNEVHFEGLFSFKNGRAVTYNEVTAPRDGLGWVVDTNRTCVFDVIHGELNYGPGLYVSPRAGPNVIKGVYLEDNCYFDPVADAASTTNSAYALGKCTQPWGIVGYNRMSSGDTVQVMFEGIFGSSPGTSPVRYQWIKLTGDASGGFVQEPDEAWVFRGMYGVRGIDSDFYNYSLDNVQASLIGASGNITRCLPRAGTSEYVTGPAATLYAGNTQSGDKSGRSNANLMFLADAVACARACKGVVTIDVSAMTSSTNPSTSVVLDGGGITRRITISGGTTGRLPYATADNVAANLTNWRAKLTITGMLAVDRLLATDSQVAIVDCPTVRTGANSDTRAAVVCDNAKVEINGTTVINPSSSTAATKIGMSLAGNSEVSFNNAAAGTIASFTAGHAIEFNTGSGTVRVSLTTATATWAASANVTRNTYGGAGVVIAPNGLNP
jgi:hypothetical protein